MAKRELSPKLIPKTYAELRDAVLAVVVAGRQAIDRAWVESYHEIGRLIHEHLLFNGRAVRKDKWELGDWEPKLVR